MLQLTTEQILPTKVAHQVIKHQVTMLAKVTGNDMSCFSMMLIMMNLRDMMILVVACPAVLPLHQSGYSSNTWTSGAHTKNEATKYAKVESKSNVLQEGSGP